MFCFPFFVLYATIKLANLIWLPENNGIFLNYSQCPHLPIFKLWEGEAVFKTFSRLWVLGFSLQSRVVGSYNTAHTAHLPHSQLSSCPTQRRVVFEKTTRGNDVEGRNSWCLLVEICVFIGLCTCQSPIAPQRSCEPILSCNQKEELNRPLTRPLKQEAGDSPCSHQRGTEL